MIKSNDKKQDVCTAQSSAITSKDIKSCISKEFEAANGLVNLAQVSSVKNIDTSNNNDKSVSSKTPKKKPKKKAISRLKSKFPLQVSLFNCNVYFY